MKEEVFTASKDKGEDLREIVVKLESRIQKLESVMESLVRSHSEQMEKIISLFMELKDKSNGKKIGKTEKEKIQSIEYFSDDDEFY